MTDRVDYDRIAARYEGRYERNDYSGIEAAILSFAPGEPGAPRSRMLEVGCGTGHWLRVLDRAGYFATGLDASHEMLNVARMRDPDMRLVHGRAEALPYQREGFDRLLSVNALHHFSDPAAFFHEARRVLHAGACLLTIGLDPHAGTDRWWIYEHFPGALEQDRRRYLAARRIRELLEASGFARCETREVQHLPARMTVADAERRGFLDRTSTSQLMVISQDEFEAGMTRIHAPAADGSERMLSADLHVYGTTAWAV